MCESFAGQIYEYGNSFRYLNIIAGYYVVCFSCFPLCGGGIEMIFAKRLRQLLGWMDSAAGTFAIRCKVEGGRERALLRTRDH